MELYLVTGNKDKLREAKQILGEQIKNIDIDLEEIQELDSDKVSEHKAKLAYEKIKKPLITWENALYLNCLNDFPGPLIKWFWKTVTLKKICELANLYNNHKIYTKTTLTYYDGKTLKHFYGILEGTIPKEPKGTNGFAWDPIFIPQGQTKTFAEMTPEEKNKISMHKIAFEMLKNYLKTI